MALLGESLVEEWLNRDGFFTIRGVKHGVDEMDLLAIRSKDDGHVIGWHVEVQISFRPIGFIAKLPKSASGSRLSARKRTIEEIEACARTWVQAKFRAELKSRVREQLWPGIDWTYHFVHAVVREQRELEIIASEGIILHPFHEILSTLAKRKEHSFLRLCWRRSRRNCELLPLLRQTVATGHVAHPGRSVRWKSPLTLNTLFRGRFL